MKKTEHSLFLPILDNWLTKFDPINPKEILNPTVTVTPTGDTQRDPPQICLFN